MLDLYDKVRKSGDVELMRRLAEDFHGRGDGTRAAALYAAMLSEIQGGDDATAWLHYLSADASRLGGEYTQAESSMRRARSLAGDLEDPELLERIDLLRFYIAHDSGDCREAMASLRVHEALAAAMELARTANGYVEEREPWALAKQPERGSELDETLASLVRVLAALAALLVPVMPEKMSEMSGLLGLDHIPKLDELEGLKVEGLHVRKGPPLFPRVEVDDTRE